MDYLNKHNEQQLNRLKLAENKTLNINDLLQDNEGNIWLLANNNELIKTQAIN